MYKGYIEVLHDDDRYVNLYNNVKINSFDCLTNQYLIVKEDDIVIDCLKWTGNQYERLSYKQINNKVDIDFFNLNTLYRILLTDYEF